FNVAVGRHVLSCWPRLAARNDSSYGVGVASLFVPGSVRAWRVGFGLSPKQSLEKSSRRGDVIADTRDACATQNSDAKNLTSSVSASASQSSALQDDLPLVHDRIGPGEVG